MKENKYSSNLSKAIEKLREVNTKRKKRVIKGMMKKFIKRGEKQN